MTSGRRAKANRRQAERQARWDFRHMSEAEKVELIRHPKKATVQLGRRIDVSHGVCKQCGRTGYLDADGNCAERPIGVAMDRHAQGLRPLRSRVKQCKERAERREKVSR